MEIRIAAGADRNALVEFNQAMAMETENKSLQTDVLSQGVAAVFDDPKKGFYVVAEADDKIAGGLMVTFEWSDWRNKWFWWIQSVYVLPEFRGQAVYSRLYQFVKQKADEAGNVCGFRLYVEHDNETAQRVYERAGMTASHYLMYEEEVQR
ncbi:MAG TPA: GNAT family N-acetyltransferase [Pyrinomonadaceae bacterium]|nr:GNAT family N-acetyltransferase [Pyrinomonadaceae bacterium]